jgi:hypothetical protein
MRSPIVLGHTTSEKLVDSEQTARHVREVEAESVALICCETLGLEGAEFCRGYIRHWLKTEKEIPNQSAARIFAAATSILKARTPAAGKSAREMGEGFSALDVALSLYNTGDSGMGFRNGYVANVYAHADRPTAMLAH